MSFFVISMSFGRLRLGKDKARMSYFVISMSFGRKRLG